MHDGLGHSVCVSVAEFQHDPFFGLRLKPGRVCDNRVSVALGRVVVLYFLASTAVCLALGIPILLASLDVKVYSVRYDDSGPMRELDSDQRAQLLYAQDGQGVPLTVEFLVTNRMKAPVTSQPGLFLNHASTCWLASCHGCHCCKWERVLAEFPRYFHNQART